MRCRRRQKALPLLFMAQKRSFSSTDISNTQDSPSQSTTHPHHDNIFFSNPIRDRSSIFIAAFSPTASRKYLQSHPDFASALHRIAAWCKQSNQTTLPLSSGSRKPPVCYESDDDGERWGGGRLARLMESQHVEHGAVIVARWYGGVMLGPVRFTWIEQCAREAIQKWRSSCHESDSIAKRAKVQPEVAEMESEKRAKESLVELLPRRDDSIAVLRQLFMEKTNVQRADPKPSAGGEKREGTGAKNEISPQKKPPNYEAMDVAVLRRLEKARDSTIALLLKKIDEAERFLQDQSGAASQNPRAHDVEGEALSSLEETNERTKQSNDELT